MAKEKGIQQQVIDAKRETGNWSAERKEGVQLEGWANFDRVVKNTPDVTHKAPTRGAGGNKR